MRWHKPSLKGIPSFWGQRAKDVGGAQHAFDNVRAAMLQATPHVAPGDPHARLIVRIHHAATLQALWYLRSDLMASIASQQGEIIARRELAAVTRLFDGLIPEARNPHGGDPSGNNR
jgi:hypothetical protein